MTATIALLSDIHANLEALNACLAHARVCGVDQYVFLGDYVGYGADAQRVVETVQDYVARGAWAVKGNHDEAVAKDAGYMNASARAAIDWARHTLSASQKVFLASLPLCVTREDACYVHASAHAPQRWDYIDSPAAALKSAIAANSPYTFCGHVHDQQLFFESSGKKMIVLAPVAGTAIPVRRHRRWVALVGSVGQPRDGNPAAAYAVFNRDREQLTFHRVPYDRYAAAAKVRKAGLPESLAYRLETGI
jgi:diadenosine tetraphosphatase ApaH/serine/threonine PP2A family protein phosphatase